MDRISDSDSEDAGSIPAGATIKKDKGFRPEALNSWIFPSSMIKRILIWLFAFILVGFVLFFGLAAHYVDKMGNKVTITKATQPDEEYLQLPFVADLHCDMLLWDRNFLDQHDYGHVDLPRLQSANVALQVFTVVSKTPRGINLESNSDDTDQIAWLSFAQLRPPSTWFSIKARALHQISQLHDFAARSEGEFRIVKSKTDLVEFISDRKKNPRLVAGMIGLEGAYCLEAGLNNLDEFYEEGVRYIGLTHFSDNEWAGSAHGVTKGGLTPAGKQLVKKMDSLGIIIDLAHVSSKTIEDIFKFTTGPLIVSHTGVRGMCNNGRNLSDKQIMAIGKRNGLIGIGLWPTAVCGIDARATARSIKYVADKIGVDKVCLGSDFDGAVTTHFDVLGLPFIIEELKSLGFNKNEIELMMGGNIRDFMLRNLPD